MHYTHYTLHIAPTSHIIHHALSRIMHDTHYTHYTLLITPTSRIIHHAISRIIP